MASVRNESRGILSRGQRTKEKKKKGRRRRRKRTRRRTKTKERRGEMRRRGRQAIETTAMRVRAKPDIVVVCSPTSA